MKQIFTYLFLIIGLNFTSLAQNKASAPGDDVAS